MQSCMASLTLLAGPGLCESCMASLTLLAGPGLCGPTQKMVEAGPYTREPRHLKCTLAKEMHTRRTSRC